ncbi:MAG: hypothetical protein ACLR0U_08630 [Enterocloster clostridioformis]
MTPKVLERHEDARFCQPAAGCDVQQAIYPGSRFKDHLIDLSGLDATKNNELAAGWCSWTARYWAFP